MPAQLRRDLEPHGVETVIARKHEVEASRQREIEAGILFLFGTPIDPILAIRPDERAVLEKTQFGFGVEVLGECVPPAKREPEFVVRSVLAESNDRSSHKLEGAAIHRLRGLQDTDVLGSGRQRTAQAQGCGENDSNDS